MIVTSCITSVTPHPDYTSITQAGMTPLQIATAYNMPSSNGSKVKIGIISFGGGYLSSDLNKSMTSLGLPTPTVTTVLMDGATGTFNANDSGASIENTLDLYCVASMVPGANIVLYQSPGDTVIQWQNVFNRAISENCDVISVSWTTAESSAGDFLSAALSNAVAKGITVLVASGDYGSAKDKSFPYEIVNYPAANPNVIAVGGTHLTLTTGNVRLTETVEANDANFAQGFGSGGGISSFIPAPPWQSNVSYNTYNSLTGMVGPTTKLTRRGIPDISAPMNAYGLYFNGIVTGVGGTSAATPVLAGMIARFISLKGSRPRSLNSVLYANPSAFYDITGGNNATEISLGYTATVGWDPVTGLGAPNGESIYRLLYPSNIKVKDNLGNWDPVINILVKTNASTWSNVKAVWTKVDSVTWKQTY